MLSFNAHIRAWKTMGDMQKNLDTYLSQRLTMLKRSLSLKWNFLPFYTRTTQRSCSQSTRTLILHHWEQHEQRFLPSGFCFDQTTVKGSEILWNHDRKSQSVVRHDRNYSFSLEAKKIQFKNNCTLTTKAAGYE